MKEFLIENIEMIIFFVTTIITFLIGIISKKKNILNDNLIPIGNIVIMIVSTGIYWWATGSFSMTIAAGSPIATLIYDTYKNLKKESENGKTFIS